VWQLFTDLFDYLPIAAIIDDSIFCVHAGLSPTIQHISDIKEIKRVQEIPHEGPFADLMWSDPDQDNSGFTLSARGAGYMFGIDVVNRFLHENNMKQIYRAH
jgi:serine/threonine-protein phosphatase PPG1